MHRLQRRAVQRPSRAGRAVREDREMEGGVCRRVGGRRRLERRCEREHGRCGADWEPEDDRRCGGLLDDALKTTGPGLDRRPRCCSGQLSRCATLWLLAIALPLSALRFARTLARCSLQDKLRMDRLDYWKRDSVFVSTSLFRPSPLSKRCAPCRAVSTYIHVLSQRGVHCQCHRGITVYAWLLLPVEATMISLNYCRIYSTSVSSKVHANKNKCKPEPFCTALDMCHPIHSYLVNICT